MKLDQLMGWLEWVRNETNGNPEVVVRFGLLIYTVEEIDIVPDPHRRLKERIEIDTGLDKRK